MTQAWPSSPRPDGGTRGGGAPLAGLGLKTGHVAQVLATGPAVDFFEVHAENYMVAVSYTHLTLPTNREV